MTAVHDVLLSLAVTIHEEISLLCNNGLFLKGGGEASHDTVTSNAKRLPIKKKRLSSKSSNYVSKMYDNFVVTG